MPTISYIGRVFKGVSDLNLLPVSILLAYSPDTREYLAGLAGPSVQDLLNRDELKVVSASSEKLEVEFGGVGLVLREIARADFDADGIEDVLCESYSWATRGTMGGGFNFVLSRTAADVLFAIKDVE